MELCPRAKQPGSWGCAEAEGLLPITPGLLLWLWLQYAVTSRPSPIAMAGLLAATTVVLLSLNTHGGHNSPLKHSVASDSGWLMALDAPLRSE